MHAAVVTSFDTPPAYTEFPTPTPQSADEVLIDVIASGLHPRVRSQADGSHYTSSGDLPLVPGIDGVGRAPDGTLRYFHLSDTSVGAMAEQTVVDLRRSVVLPDDADPVLRGRRNESRYVLVGRSSPAHQLRAWPNGADPWRHRQLRPAGGSNRQAPWCRPRHRCRAQRCAALGPQRPRSRQHRPTRRRHGGK